LSGALEALAPDSALSLADGVAEDLADDAAVLEPVRRKRLKPGERRAQILQTLAAMLEQPGTERITTAALAARLGVSEAALYRHFASKAQMFEGLIAFIEDGVLTRLQQLAEQEADPATRSRKQVKAVLQFAEKNPGMVRVMVGDALVFEHERLQVRMSQFFDKLETCLLHNLREAAAHAGTPAAAAAAAAAAAGAGAAAAAAGVAAAGASQGNAQVRASVLAAFIVGRLQRFARSGFRRLPSEHLSASLAMILD
jgi:TetR/AcrR family transcriptional regulator